MGLEVGDHLSAFN
jgi:hypothetical protein